MRDGGRIAAAIEIVEDIEARRKPAKLAMKAWGDAHRFAGSGDRAWIAGLVLDALRRRRSLAWIMEADSPRAVCLGVLRYVWAWPLDRIAAACAETPHGPGELTSAEGRRLAPAARTHALHAAARSVQHRQDADRGQVPS